MLPRRFSKLLAAAQAGDERAFGALWHNLQPALVRYLRCLDHDRAEELSADTWQLVVERMADFRGDEQEWRLWVFTLARQLALDETRLLDGALTAPAGHHRPTATTTTPEDGSGDDPVAAGDAALRRLDVDWALALVQQLPPVEAETLVLQAVGRLSPAHTGHLLGRSPEAVREATQGGLHILAELVTREESTPRPW